MTRIKQDQMKPFSILCLLTHSEGSGLQLSSTEKYKSKREIHTQSKERKNKGTKLTMQNLVHILSFK